jgi:hypothetical protein
VNFKNLSKDAQAATAARYAAQNGISFLAAFKLLDETDDDAPNVPLSQCSREQQASAARRYAQFHSVPFVDACRHLGITH